MSLADSVKADVQLSSSDGGSSTGGDDCRHGHTSFPQFDLVIFFDPLPGGARRRRRRRPTVRARSAPAAPAAPDPTAGCNDRSVTASSLLGVVCRRRARRRLVPRARPAARGGVQARRPGQRAAQPRCDAARQPTSPPASRAKRDYAHDYATVARLGTAVPDDDNVASLLVQVEPRARTRAGRLPLAEGRPGLGGSGARCRPRRRPPTRRRPATQAATATLPPGRRSEPPASRRCRSASSSTATSSHLSDFIGRLEHFLVVRNRALAVRGRFMTLDGISLERRAEGLPAHQGERRRDDVPAARRPGPDQRRDARTDRGRLRRDATPTRPAAPGDRDHDRAMSSLRNLWSDLVEKRLWPVAAAAARRARRRAARACEDRLRGAADRDDAGGRRAGGRRRGAGAAALRGAGRERRVGAAAAARRCAATRRTRSSSSTCPRSPPRRTAAAPPGHDGPTDGGGTPSGRRRLRAAAPPPAPQPAGSRTRRTTCATVDVRFGEAGPPAHAIEDVPRLAPLPSAAHPVAIFLGMRKDLRDGRLPDLLRRARQGDGDVHARRMPMCTGDRAQRGRRRAARRDRAPTARRASTSSTC